MNADVTVSREIAAPADRVWALVSDLPGMGQYSPEATGGSWKGGATGPALGAKFSGRNRNGWHRWSTTATVVASEPGRVFAFDVSSGPIEVAQWRYEIEPTDEGCRVTESWTDRRAGWFRTVTGPAVGVKDRTAHNRASMETTLERLAQAAQAGTA